MFLSVMWAMTAAMVGFSLGRVSMYGEPVYGEESEGEEADAISGATLADKWGYVAAILNSKG